jgi:hypothetical protein
MPLRYAALPAKKLRRVEVVLAVGLQIRGGRKIFIANFQFSITYQHKTAWVLITFC